MKCPKCGTKMKVLKYWTKKVHCEFYWCPKKGCHETLNKTKDPYDC